MCGIGGILRITPPGEKHEPIPDEWLDAMDRHIAWRGPDGHGRFRDKVVRPDGTIVEVALVHRRLAIIDIECGHQPMVWMKERGVLPAQEQYDFQDRTDAGELVAVVFNGCIYNHRALRAELERSGHRFSTDHSDTEVLLHFRSRLDEFFTRADAMGAFALWDGGRAVLTLARDLAGEKPLYVAHLPGCTVLASTVPACRAVLERALDRKARAELEAHALADFLALGYSPLRTPHPAVRQLAPGQMVELPLDGEDPRTLRIGTEALRHAGPRRGAKSDAPPVCSPETAGHWIERAVAARLDADVPVCCLLSGGIDSSLIALYAARALAPAPLVTINVRMPDERTDESEFAARAAEIIGSEHHIVDASPDPLTDFVDLIQALGLPFGDSSLLPTFWACRAVAAHAKVALSGDGGDELFYGYERYRAAQAMRLPPFAMLACMFFPEDLLDRSDPGSRSTRISRYVVAVRNRGYSDLAAIFPSPDFAQLIRGRSVHRSFRLSHRPVAPTFDPRRFGGARAARQFDLENYLPGDLLRKVDTASLLAGIEVRCPFLDRELMKCVHAAPRAILYSPRETKPLLRELARRYFPPEITDRPKQGFAIPIGEWFRTDYGGLRTCLLDYLHRPRPFGAVHDVLDINMKYVRAIVDEHMSAGGAQQAFSTVPARRRDHSQRLFMLLSLAIWAEKCLDGRGG